VSFLRRHLPPTLHNAIGGIITAGVLAVVSLAVVLVPRIRAFAARQVALPAWLAFLLAICAIVVMVRLVRWLFVQPRDSRVHLFRSLSREEQDIMRILAHSEFGISEGELCQQVPAPPQRFLYFIDHLVRGLRLVDRTEPASGGAYWFLSERGRGVAAANRLFDNEPNEPTDRTAPRSDA
jgi:hypothetical protein